MRRDPNKHWTAGSVEDFQYDVAASFVDQLETRLKEKGWQQKALAVMLGKSESWVSQLFNDPGNLGLRTMVSFADKLGLKLSVLAYDDDDPDRVRGPVHADVFRRCWEMLGKPRNFFDLEERQRKWKFEMKRVQNMSVVEGGRSWQSPDLLPEPGDQAQVMGG